MGKTKETEGDQPEATRTGEQAEYKAKHLSTDVEAGIVVFETDAPDGTGFTVSVNGEEITADAASGQVWFYAGHPFLGLPFVRLK